MPVFCLLRAAISAHAHVDSVADSWPLVKTVTVDSRSDIGSTVGAASGKRIEVDMAFRSLAVRVREAGRQSSYHATASSASSAASHPSDWR